MKKKHEPIPKDFAVQPLKPNQEAQDRCTCGYCGLSWDDAIPTSWTPAPSARCPFEYFHVHEEEKEKPPVTIVYQVVSFVPYEAREAGKIFSDIKKAFKHMEYMKQKYPDLSHTVESHVVG